ncbi:hypothetical protein GYB22_09100, partial [bacterium]|nr:hypothetical protein [bacterium]
MDSFDAKETLFTEVILPLNLKKAYTYRIPLDLNERIQVGQRVIVPFGKNKVYAGIVYQ